MKKENYIEKVNKIFKNGRIPKDLLIFLSKYGEQ